MLQARLNPNIGATWIHFQFYDDLLRVEQGRILNVLKSGAGSGAGEAISPLLTGKTLREAEEFFEARRVELEFLTMLELVATAEAILRLRVRAKKKDDLSKRFRYLRKQRARAGRPGRIKLDEDILAAIDETGVRVSEFRGALRLRNWLAHGRYWEPKLGRTYTPEDIYEISDTLLRAIA